MIGHFKSVKKFYSTFLFGKELPCIFLQVQKLEQTVRFPPKSYITLTYFHLAVSMGCREVERCLGMAQSTKMQSTEK